MPRSSTAWFSAGLVVLCFAASAGAAQPTTRIFAMQPKLSLAWMDSRAHYHDKLFALADKSLRGPAAPLTQDGADDFASHLREDGRNLVVWPEDIGLWTSFTGHRGDEARGSGSLVGAIATLLTAYSPQMTYYSGVYPDVAARTPQVRLLALALTDTFGRVAVETFSELAAKYHVWLEAGVDMTQRWRIVCNTDEHPPQQACDEQSPAKVQVLRDPEEPDRGYAYEAISPDVSNMALVFAPNGALVSTQVKNYITPIEVGQAEGQLAALDLVPGSITSGLGAVRTTVGTLGFVTSKDAWMPDVVDRLEEDGVDVLIQPEFFEHDLATTSGMWAADTLKASGYSDVLRHPGFAALALPSAVGNVFDFSADQQSHIAQRLDRPRAGDWLIGQPPGPGLVGVTPWVVPDPLTPDEPIAERRKRLGEAGKKLTPRSGVACPDPAKPGACEGGHVETTLWKDVPVGRPAYHSATGLKRRRTRFLAARALGRKRLPERNAAVAMGGRYVAVAYEQQLSYGSRVLVAVSRDRGRHWLIAHDAVPQAPPPQQWPAITVDGRGRMTLAWVTATTVPRVVFSQGHVTRSGALKFNAPKAIDPDAPADAPQWKPALARDSTGVVHAAFVDARSTSADAGLPQAGIYYTRIRAGTAGPAKRLDEGPADPLAAKLDNAWAPALAVRGRDVIVSWIDFVHYDWDVFSRLSHDGGDAFEKPVDSNPEPKDVENLSDSPKPLFTTGGPLITWTDFHKRDSVDKVHPLYDTYLAAPGKPPLQVDPYGGKQVETFWPSACGYSKDAFVAFQDSATGVPKVRITRVRAGTTRGHAFPLSDTSAGAYRPSIACSGRYFAAAWEDTRTGAARIYATAGSLTRIR